MATITLAGFGSHGYTTDASLSDRRTGRNVVDSFERETGGDGLLFRYDFDAPDTTGEPGGSLGNRIETLIGPGDSGGPALLWEDGGLALAGLNSFTEGFGGRFGDFGGGVALDPHWDWISETTGLANVPEPAQFGLFLGCASLGGLFVVRRRKRATEWEMEKGGVFRIGPDRRRRG